MWLIILCYNYDIINSIIYLSVLSSLIFINYKYFNFIHINILNTIAMIINIIIRNRSDIYCHYYDFISEYIYLHLSFFLLLVVLYYIYIIFIIIYLFCIIYLLFILLNFYLFFTFVIISYFEILLQLLLFIDISFHEVKLIFILARKFIHRLFYL